MSTDISKYALYSNKAADKRALAVAAALSIIQAKVANAPTNGTIVSDEMANLKAYADQIEEALKTS